MRALTFLFFALALIPTPSVFGEDAFRVGNGNWGMEMYITSAPRECAPLRLYYSIDHNGDPPIDLVLPDDAAISFLTPDAGLTEWMVLRPPMDTGILEWTCTLRSGKQFVIRNGSGFRQMFTVGPPSSGAQCGQNATTFATSSPFGSLNAQAYKSLTANNYAPTSISPANQFSSHAMPSTEGLRVDIVVLGAAISPDPTSPTQVATQTPVRGATPTPTPSTVDSGGTGSESTTLSRSSITASPNGTIAPQNSTTDQAIASPLGTASDAGHTQTSASPTGKSQQEPAGSPSHSAMAPKTIIAIALAIVLFAALVGAALFLHTRRVATRRRAALQGVSALPTVRLPDASFESGGTETDRDRKYLLLLDPVTVKQPMPPTVVHEAGPSTLAPDDGVRREAPPGYSRYQ